MKTRMFWFWRRWILVPAIVLIMLVPLWGLSLSIARRPGRIACTSKTIWLGSKAVCGNLTTTYVFGYEMWGKGIIEIPGQTYAAKLVGQRLQMRLWGTYCKMVIVTERGVVAEMTMYGGCLG